MKKILNLILLVPLFFNCGGEEKLIDNSEKKESDNVKTEFSSTNKSKYLDLASSTTPRKYELTFFKDNEIEILSKVISDSLIYQLDSLEGVLSSYSVEEDLISIYHDARELKNILNAEIENNTAAWTWKKRDAFYLEWETIDTHQVFIFGCSMECLQLEVSLSLDNFIQLAQKKQNKRDNEYFLLLSYKKGYWQRKWRSFCCDYDYFVTLGDSSMINFVMAASYYIKKYDAKKLVNEYESIASIMESLSKDILHGRYDYQKEKILSELDLLIEFESDILSSSKDKMRLLRKRIINDQLECEDCNDGIGTIQLNCSNGNCPCC